MTLTQVFLGGGKTKSCSQAILWRHSLRQTGETTATDAQWHKVVNEFTQNDPTSKRGAPRQAYPNDVSWNSRAKRRSA
eukprot:CAMPEP_0117590066 /NCGR_PEP_ID=MMETSP0784-20121206/70768_1 /TAXON_ID=39447 /ORGANISM="" /LENGTH=77 /DNA_ID=CAMNT_0005391631 /DNA_START=85 /DNA_END=314 /DNA_ORIENTATION=-